MNRVKAILCLLFVLAIGEKMQAQSSNIEEVNRLYNYYCSEGLFTNASNLLTEKGNYYLENGDTLSAYELQLRNCILTDAHLEEFFRYGLTWEGYFANWYTTISIAAWLGKREQAASELLRILDMISTKEPRLLPFYSSTLSYILYDYKTSSDYDSIDLLQKALDYIKTIEPSHDIVNQYNKITECFYINRFYQGFDNTIDVEKRFGELERWYTKNHSYITNLDTSQYKQEILKYEMLFVDQIMAYAGSKDNYEAIERYKKALSVLEPLVVDNDSLSQKIAACNARIASSYYILREYALSKEYSDKALPFLANHKDDFDYCDILNTLSSTYFKTNYYDLATRLKLEEMTIREKLGWHCTSSDWQLYFLYAGKIDPKIIIEDKDLALFMMKVNDMVVTPGFYIEVGKAFSNLMGLHENYKDSAELYFSKADSAFTIQKEYFDKNELGNTFKLSYYGAWAGHYINLGELQKAYNLLKKGLQYSSKSDYSYYHNLALLSTFLHKTEDIHEYLPAYYYGEKEELVSMIPVLGEVESSQYLGFGIHSIYNIPEWASWNTIDSVSVSIAYDATLLTKGLLLRYNTVAPYIEKHSNLIIDKQELELMRDSIFTINDANERFCTLYRYEQREREILKKVKNEISNTHWKDVANGLKNNEVCIEFVKYTANSYSWCEGISKPHYAALLISSDYSFPQFIDLFGEDDLMDTYRLQPKSYDIECGHVLYSKLWGTLNPYIENKERVFFSPMGLLNLINIELLSDSTGKTALDRYNLHRVSSTKNILAKAANEKIKQIVAFGGVDYENATEFDTTMLSLNTRGNWSFLHNTKHEVEQLRKSMMANNIYVDTYIGTNATETRFKSLDGTHADIIHIASHGYYIPQSKRATIPYFSNSNSTQSIQDELFYSGLIMSGGQRAWTDSTFSVDKNDGVLTAYEISKLDLHNVELVVLSACETGLGDNLFDGIFGLQRAFKKSGVQSILMSLWEIDDKATSEYMELMYERIASGSSIHDSYNSTVLAMKEKYPDANYWASFILLD